MTKSNSFIFLFLLLHLPGLCQITSKKQNNQALNNRTLTETNYINLVRLLNPVSPGSGIDYYNNEVKDRPMAYGLILSAETKRYKYTKNIDALKNAKNYFLWIKNNSDLNNNKISGYGLADEWDAFSDGTINPPNQEYTITTGIVINGLLDYYNIATELEKVEIITLVKGCVSPYLRSDNNSPDGLYTYSLNTNDENWSVFNPAIYLAGQMQRFSTIINNNKMRKELIENANKNISILLQHSLENDSTKGMYWNYGIGEHRVVNRPNDLVHALYILEGIKSYDDYNGKLINSKTRKKAVSHLSEFKSKDLWYEFIIPEMQTEKRNSRLWALGMLLYTLSDQKKIGPVQNDLLIQISRYKLESGHYKFRLNDEKVMVRQEAHLLYGMSNFLYGK